MESETSGGQGIKKTKKIMKWKGKRVVGGGRKIYSRGFIVAMVFITIQFTYLLQISHILSSKV
jgi:hypothetical protein